MAQIGGGGAFGVRSIEQRADAFLEAQETSDEFAQECMWRLVDRDKEHAGAIKRAAVGMVISGVLFELLNRRLVGEASGFGIKLARLDFLVVFIPVVVAYLFLRLASAELARQVVNIVVFRISEKRFPGLYKSAIDEILLSDARPTTVDVPNRYFPNPRTRRLVDFAGIAEGEVLSYAPVAFEIYAFWQLAARYGVGSVPFWLSLLVSLSLLVYANIFAFFVDRIQ